jgi:thiamine pyrophosphokinase
MPTAESILVVVGGGPLRAPAGHFDLVIAADSGVDGALGAGLRPDVVVGDLDSISSAGLEWAAQHGVAVESHPADKDLTDTALALHCAAIRGGTTLTLVAPDGDDPAHRLDHMLGVIAALGDPVLAGFESVTAHLGRAVLHVLHPGRAIALHRPVGTVFSLLAAHGPCRGVELVGARWPLHEAELPAATTRGVSNAVVSTPVTASVGDGVLTIVVPEVVR